MKVEAKDFGTNRQWKELGSDMTKLRGKVDVLSVKIDDVQRHAQELARFTDAIRIVTFTAIMFLMTYLLVTQFIG
jgi:hypothetical protein